MLDINGKLTEDIEDLKKVRKQYAYTVDESVGLYDKNCM